MYITYLPTYSVANTIAAYLIDKPQKNWYYTCIRYNIPHFSDNWADLGTRNLPYRRNTMAQNPETGILQIYHFPVKFE